MKNRYSNTKEIFERIEALEILLAKEPYAHAKEKRESIELKDLVAKYLPNLEDVEQKSLVDGILNNTRDLTEAASVLKDEQYRIYADTEDYAEEYLDNCDPIPEVIRYHIDLEALAETLLDGQPEFRTASGKLVVIWL